METLCRLGRLGRVFDAINILVSAVVHPMYPTTTFFLLCLLVAACAGGQAPGGLHFVSISGWPQSGTSLLQQILTTAPASETMVHMCFHDMGKRCMHINNEGQWLLGNTKPPLKHWINTVYGPGRMCEAPLDGEGAQDVGGHIVKQWFKHWRLNYEVVVQKSPQDLLKLSYLDDIFRPVTSSRRFVVIIKHPATLNTALPRNRDWLHELLPSNKGEKKKTALSAKAINENFEYFSSMMMKRSSSAAPFNISADSTRCDSRGSAPDSYVDLGWLLAMELFEKRLSKSAGIRERVRVVRFEDLILDPYGFCQSLLSFTLGALDENLIRYNQDKICNSYFRSAKIPKRAISSKVGGRSLSTGGGQVSPHATRQLRLRKTEKTASMITDGAIPKMYTEINFRRDFASASVVGRLSMLRKVIGSLSTKNRAILMSIEKRLLRFGYSLVGKKNPSKVQSRDYAEKSAYFLGEDKLVLGYFPYLYVIYQQNRTEFSSLFLQ